MARKIAYCLSILLCGIVLFGCSSSDYSLVYANGQVAINTNDKNVSYDSKDVYKSIKGSIVLSFEAMNVNRENENMIVVNDHRIPIIPSLESRNQFLLYEVQLLGANVVDGNITVSFEAGKDDFGNTDVFSIRKVFLQIGNTELWAKDYPKDQYENEKFQIGPIGMNDDYRFGYIPKRNFTFSIPNKHLNCYAMLVENERGIDFTSGKTEKSLVNHSYIDLSINIENDQVIDQNIQLDINALDCEVSIESYMDGLLIPNDLQLNRNAWSPGKHTLSIQATNEWGFSYYKTIDFSLEAVLETASNLEYKTFDPGMASTLPKGKQSLGKEVEHSGYQSNFSAIPYLNYEITDSDDSSIEWSGTIPVNRTAFMQIYNVTTLEYETVSTTTYQNNGEVKLGYNVTNKNIYSSNGKIYVRVGNINLTKEKKPTSYIYHVTDVQYISQKASLHEGTSANTEAKAVLRSIADFLLERDPLNSYAVMTGDFVQTKSKAELEWVAVMENMINPLLENDYRFGASSGNHDVGGLSENSSAGGNALDDELYYNFWSDNLGEHVFADKDYFGGSFLDNRSHYDLITYEGHEFLFLYLGWGSTEVGIHVSSIDIAYGKTVLEAHPDKTVVLATHDYVGSQNNRTKTGEYVFEQLVKPYANIKMVLSGHVNGTSQKIDYLDSDNDGITDRAVLQLLTDLQEEEDLYGASFIRMIGLDFQNNQMIFSLYSPFYKTHKPFVNANPIIVNNNTQFIYDFDLSKLGYGMISNELK